jgi:HAD superfamily hydrolase (TIGR01490 family)
VAIPSDNASPPGIALFDLDGTLLAWDCQLLFRDFVVRREPWRRVFLLPFLALVPLAPLLGKNRMKSVFLAFLWRMPEEQLAGFFRDFADSVMPLIYPDVRDLLEKHRASDHLLILASASPEGYVKEIGARLGFDISLGTVVQHGPLFPHLVNHRGRAKSFRLHAVLGNRHFSHDKLIHSHGYTDSTADLPMLALCDAATVVNPKPRLEAIARENGWTIVRPQRPWSGSLDRACRSLCLLLSIGKDPAGRGCDGSNGASSF